MSNELQLKQVRLVLVDMTITIQINQRSIEYSNEYTAFDFDVETKELTAPNFKLIVNNSSDVETLARWFESLYL
ncbi:hypothetical protein [Vibrio pomeroyi]|uniref:hypothetical protein n=1 Tax=Vibrio pomeroyi TaxID=198832 RepID=UPI0021C291A0|nr:hypothetical protein [Vibrio pomeroyi]